MSYHPKILEYLRPDGTNPYQRWFNKLPPEAAAKVAVAILKLERGATSAIKWLDGGIGEYRINWGPGYRIYLARDGVDLIVLFGGGTKVRQSRDIATAKALYKEYKSQEESKKKPE
jgi:putative addiction module killer protein